MSMRDNSAQTTSLSAESANELPSVVANLLTSEIETPNKREIPFAIGLDSLPVAARTQTNLAEVVPGSSGGIFPSSSSLSTAVSTSWTMNNLNGYFDNDESAKQIVCPMTLFQSFPVIESDGTVTRVTDATSLGDGAGTNLGGIACTVVNGGKSGYADSSNISVLLSQYNGGVKNYTVGAAIGLMYVDAWIHKFFPELSWRDGKDRKTSWGNVRSGGCAGSLVARGCLWAEAVFPVSATDAKALKIKIVDVAPAHEGPRLDIMPTFCLINSHRDIFTIKGKRNGSYHQIDGEKIAFMFQDCSYDYVKGEIVGYSPENVYKKFYPSFSKLFENAPSVFNNSKSFKNYIGGTVGGPKGVNGFSIVKVRFFIDPSAKEKAEKIIGCPIPDELMKVNF